MHSQSGKRRQMLERQWVTIELGFKNQSSLLVSHRLSLIWTSVGVGGMFHQSDFYFSRSNLFFNSDRLKPFILNTQSTIFSLNRLRILARVAGNQRRCLCHIMTRTCRQGKTQRDKRISHRSIEFRGKAAFTPTEGC